MFPTGVLQLLLLLLVGLAVAPLLPRAAADVAVLSDAVLAPPPLWARNRTADVVLDFSKADADFKFPSPGTVSFRGRDMKVRRAAVVCVCVHCVCLGGVRGLRRMVVAHADRCLSPLLILYHQHHHL